MSDRSVHSRTRTRATADLGPHDAKQTSQPDAVPVLELPGGTAMRATALPVLTGRQLTLHDVQASKALSLADGKALPAWVRHALTPGRQRSDVIHLNSARKTETRITSISGWPSRILAAKGAAER